MSMRLYYSPPTCSLAAMAAIGMTQAAFTPVAIDLAGDRSFLKAANPFGKVPVLEDGGLFVSDTIAIIFRLNTRFPEAHLLPQDDAGLALTLSRMAWLGSELHILRRRVTRPLAFASDPAAQASVRNQALPLYRGGLAMADSWYAASDAGLCPGLDAYVLLFLHWALIDGLETAPLGGLMSLASRMKATPGVVQALALHESPLLKESSWTASASA